MTTELNFLQTLKPPTYARMKFSGTMRKRKLLEYGDVLRLADYGVKVSLFTVTSKLSTV